MLSSHIVGFVAEFPGANDAWKKTRSQNAWNKVADFAHLYRRRVNSKRALARKVREHDLIDSRVDNNGDAGKKQWPRLRKPFTSGGQIVSPGCHRPNNNSKQDRRHNKYEDAISRNTPSESEHAGSKVQQNNSRDRHCCERSVLRINTVFRLSLRLEPDVKSKRAVHQQPHTDNERR